MHCINLFYFNTHTRFGEECILSRSSLCNFLTTTLYHNPNQTWITPGPHMLFILWSANLTMHHTIISSNCLSLQFKLVILKELMSWSMAWEWVFCQQCGVTVHCSVRWPILIKNASLPLHSGYFNMLTYNIVKICNRNITYYDYINTHTHSKKAYKQYSGQLLCSYDCFNVVTLFTNGCHFCSSTVKKSLFIFQQPFTLFRWI